MDIALRLISNDEASASRSYSYIKGEVALIEHCAR
jgi:hypothetical protein